MLTHIVRPSPALDTFLCPLIACLTLPQRQHLLEIVDALLVTEHRKTLAALQRQLLDTSDLANWADFLRISPWSADGLRDRLRRQQLAWLLAEAQQHRGRAYHKKILFPLMAQLVRDALLEPDGSGHKSFCQAQQDGILPAVLSCTYDKLAHLPPALSEAFPAEGGDRLRQVFPDTQVTQLDDPIAPSLADFEFLVVDNAAGPARSRPSGPPL